MQIVKKIFPRLFSKPTDLKTTDSFSDFNDAGVESFSGVGTVLSINIQNIGSLTETMQPEEIIQTLSVKHRAALNLIGKCKGIVVYQIGGEILAYWKNLESTSVPDETKIALSTAMGLMQIYSPLVHVRIVLSSGEIFGDFFGPQQQFQIRGAAVEYSKNLMMLSREYFANQSGLFLLSPKTVAQVNIDESQIQLVRHNLINSEVFELVGY